MVWAKCAHTSYFAGAYMEPDLSKNLKQKFILSTDANLAERIQEHFTALYGKARPESFEALINTQNRARELMRELCRRYQEESRRAP